MADKGRLTDDMIKNIIDTTQQPTWYNQLGADTLSAGRDALNAATWRDVWGDKQKMEQERANLYKRFGATQTHSPALDIARGAISFGAPGGVFKGGGALLKVAPKIAGATNLGLAGLKGAEATELGMVGLPEVASTVSNLSKGEKVAQGLVAASGIYSAKSNINPSSPSVNTNVPSMQSTNIQPLSLTQPKKVETMSNVKANEFPTTETTPNKNTTPAPSTEMSGILPDGSYGIFGTKQDNTAYNQERDIANARIDAQRAEDLKKVELDNAIFKEENRVLGGGTDPETLRYLKQQKFGAKGVNPMQDVQSREANATTRFGMEKAAETAKANQQATQNYRQQQLQQTAQKLAWDKNVDLTKLNQEQQKTYLDQADKLLKRDADYSGRLWKNFEVRDNDGTGNPQPEKTLFNIAKSGVKLPETDTNLINMVNQMNQRRLAFQRSKYGDAKLTTEQLAQVDKDFMETLQ
jgi:hypothetical protein